VTLIHGSIVGGLATVPDLESALADYRDCFGLRVVADAPVGDSLAASWGCHANAGSRMVTLQPRSGTHGFLRLVEQPVPKSFRPTTTYGWAAFELTVEDVFAWPQRLASGGFRVVGEPKEIPGLPYFVAMQVVGTGGEMLYLNESRSDTPTSDLPKARSPIDHIFIVILAARERAESVAWYRDRLGLDESETHVIPYSMINKAFGMPLDTLTALTMVQNGRMPIVEVDDYPEAASERLREPGRLPPGNALVSLAVESLDACRCDWIVPPSVQAGPLYAGRRSATTVGAAGELIELLELATAAAP
jgi:catechol 2,3-dioxygenase-like lactoylglutathione lyase family enzyme